MLLLRHAVRFGTKSALYDGMLCLVLRVTSRVTLYPTTIHGVEIIFGNSQGEGVSKKGPCDNKQTLGGATVLSWRDEHRSSELRSINCIAIKTASIELRSIWHVSSQDHKAVQCKRKLCTLQNKQRYV